jgi:hypothetical protein
LQQNENLAIDNIKWAKFAKHEKLEEDLRTWIGQIRAKHDTAAN